MKGYIKVKLKTGYFAKTEYSLRIGKDGLCFVPLRGEGEKIVIAAADIKNVTLNEPKLKMEMQAAGGLYVVDIADTAGFQKTLQALKENIAAKIVCEMN